MLATVIAGFSVILGAQHLSYANFEGKISCLRQYMSYMHVPPALRQRVINYHFYLWARQRGLAQSDVVDRLPMPFRREINLVLAYRVLAECPLFETCDLGFMYAVAGALQLQLYAPMDALCREGEIGNRDIKYQACPSHPPPTKISHIERVSIKHRDIVYLTEPISSTSPT